MDGWVDRGRRHQDPSLIAQSKGAARGRMEMFDHRLKVYRNADPGAFLTLPLLFLPCRTLNVLLGSADPRMVSACCPRHSNHISIRSIGRSTRPRTETFNRSQTNRQSTNRHVSLNLPPRYNNHKSSKSSDPLRPTQSALGVNDRPPITTLTDDRPDRTD
jgi:hypothetical protein